MNKLLLVGLGNIGDQYTFTRHNVGFCFVDELAKDHKATFVYNKKFLGGIAVIQSLASCDQEILLLKPHTYMNLSGDSVALVANFYKLPTNKILVIHDDLDLPVGTVKLKQGGGSAGHNGLKSIDAKLATNLYWRLRLGIGRPPHNDTLGVNGVANYVLSKPTPSEQLLLDDATQYAINTLLSPWLARK